MSGGTSIRAALDNSISTFCLRSDGKTHLYSMIHLTKIKIEMKRNISINQQSFVLNLPTMRAEYKIRCSL